MPAQSLIFYPDPRLRQVADPVVAFDHELACLATDLLLTLDAVSAIGLAAPHIGRMHRLVALRLDPGKDAAIYVNPDLVWMSPARASQIEGSVSMPGISETVERAARVRVRYRDLAGMEQFEEAEGFRSACLQHEIDQLDGRFWIERLSRLKRERAVKRFAKLRRMGA